MSGRSADRMYVQERCRLEGEKGMREVQGRTGLLTFSELCKPAYSFLNSPYEVDLSVFSLPDFLLAQPAPNTCYSRKAPIYSMEPVNSAQSRVSLVCEREIPDF